ncbi:MAG: division/cell wall cluster transcriptional repressor MraZ [Candidatus Sumerlaeaceae bacterium]
MGDETKNSASLSQRLVGFFGNYAVRLDAANRLPIPAKFREVLEARFGHEAYPLMLMPGDGYIRVVPYAVWSEMSRQLEQASKFSPEAARLKMLLYGNMADCELDSQNRVRIPAGLCELIELERDAMVVGCGDELAIWRRHAWEKFNVESSKRLNDLMSEFSRSQMPKE